MRTTGAALLPSRIENHRIRGFIPFRCHLTDAKTSAPSVVRKRAMRPLRTLGLLASIKLR